MTPALVLAAHGSRDPRFAVTAGRIRDAVASALPEVDVTVAFLDLDVPALHHVLRATVARQVIVVPLLFSTAFHATVDIPSIIESARTHRRDLIITQTPSLGGDTRLVAALADRLSHIESRPDDGIIACAVGSRDPASDRGFADVAEQLSTAVGGRPVRTVFATRLGTDARHLHAAIDGLRSAGARRIVLSPYFLSAGTLTDRVENALDRLAPTSAAAPPIAAHPSLVGVVCDRYRAAERAFRKSCLRQM